MATFVEVISKSGDVKFKAMCRLRVKGNLANRCKTFPDMDQALAWAEVTERAMRLERDSPVATFDGILGDFTRAMDRLSVFRDKSLKLFRSYDLYQYLKGRVAGGASEQSIAIDIDILYSMFRHSDDVNGTNNVQLLMLAMNRHEIDMSRKQTG